MLFAFLTALYEDPGPWTTVLMDTSMHSETEAAKRSLMAEDIARDLADQGAPETDCAAVRDTLGVVGKGGEPAGRALFVRAGKVVVDVPLLTAPLRSEGHFAQLPRVSPVLLHAGAGELCLVAYIDRTGADFELRATRPPRAAGFTDGTQYPVHRTGRADWSERHFQLKVEETWEHNAREIAAALTQAQEETGADVLVLAGDARERRAVHVSLPEPLRELSVETSHSGRAPGASSPLLDDDIAEARRTVARRRWQREFQRFATARTPETGVAHAVEGVPLLVEAAREGRIATLLIDADGSDTTREVWIGPRTHQIAVRRTESQYLGETDPTAARADDALVRSAVAAGADVLVLPADSPGASEESLQLEGPEETAVVEGEGPPRELESPVGGLGALLHGTAETH